MLKLAKLPDRTPVKITIAVTPDLHAALNAYLALYRATYEDRGVGLADIVPAMLDAFLTSDRAFIKARRNTEEEN